jgi:hypothetical protein
MKLLTLSLNRLELARFQLRKPLIVVGRAPTCDVVLRAPTIKPVHFIIEWIGSGKFNPKAGQWSIADVSEHADAGEGLVLGAETLKLSDVSFVLVDSNLESSEVIGGKIVDSLSEATSATPELLEFVQVRNDSGAVEEVRHIALPKKSKTESISKEFKSFKIERPKLSTNHLLNIVLDEMPGAELFLSGRKLSPATKVPLGANDFLQVKWRGRDFYLRFVDVVHSPPIPQDFWGDSLNKYLTLGFAAVLLAFFLLRSDPANRAPEVVPPVRVARIELPAVPAPVEKPPVPVETKANPAPHSAIEAPTKKADAAKVISQPNAKAKAGINNHSTVSNVNTIGILGALNKNAKRGGGVRADKVINNGIIHNAVTGAEDSQVIVANPPSGVLGKKNSGDPHGGTRDNLVSASTTLTGTKTVSPNSASLIARSGGTGNAKLGGGDGEGTSINSNGDSNRIGESANDFSVDGGLDRDTVRRIIQSYRSQVRACYDRALVSSPNLHGRVVYRWKILSDGGVDDTSIQKATLDSANLKSCVLEVIQRMQFPKSTRGLSTTVIYPFVFQGLK